jgi:hypothetical protein
MAASSDLLPDADAIAERLKPLVATKALVEGPERLIQFKLKQVARRSGGMMVVPIFREEREMPVGWMGVGVRMAIAIGGLMLQDPEVREKVGSIDVDDILIDAAHEVLNITASAFNLQLEAMGQRHEIRIGQAVQVGPADVEERRIDVGAGVVSSLYKVHFPYLQAPSLTKRRGALSISFVPEDAEAVETPKLEMGGRS